jgi:hypothetical protein
VRGLTPKVPNRRLTTAITTRRPTLQPEPTRGEQQHTVDAAEIDTASRSAHSAGPPTGWGAARSFSS